MKKKNHRQRLLTGLSTAFLLMAAVSAGTFAWQNRTQTGLNETILDIMPGGGRIHDDWNGTNKDVYAENYTGKDADGNGLDPVNLFVRIRLSEYMETGKDAGQETETETDGSPVDRVAEPVLAEDDGNALVWNNADTWRVRKPGDTSEDNPFLNYWDWVYGTENSSTIYMPTFNKNSDSLAVDVNGTYEGKNGTPYDDYETYADGQTEETEAYYDADDNLDDEDTSMPGNGGTLHTNYEENKETHTAKRTQTSKVITMAEWTDTESTYYHKFGNFWVWDEDGWFYWARPLFAGETTGLLLDAVKQKVYLGDNTFYGIHVTGEFATADDFGSDEDTENEIPASGFHKNGITGDAEELLENIKDIVLGANGKDLYKNCGYNIYKKIDVTTGALGPAVCAGEDQIIGNSDDKDNVIERKEDLVLNGKNYGKYLLKEKDGVYYVMGDNELLGTDEDKKLWYTESDNVRNDADEGNYSFDAPTVTITLGRNTSSPVNFGTANFMATATFANGRNFSPSNRRFNWAFSGNKNSNTKVTANINNDYSQIQVNIDEGEAGNTALKLKAELNGYPELNADFTVQIIGPDRVTIREDNGKNEVEPGTTLKFKATVESRISNYPIQDVTWSLVDGDGNSLISANGLTLTPNGTKAQLSIDASMAPGDIYVRAAFTTDSSIYANYKVTILGPTSVSIGGPQTALSVKVGQSHQFSASVMRDGNLYANQDIIWSVKRTDNESVKSGTKIDRSTGKLDVDVDEVRNITLRVTATSASDSTIKKTIDIEVPLYVYENNGKSKIITLDNIDFYVIAQDGNNLLLRSKYCTNEQKNFSNTAFGLSPATSWFDADINRSCDIRTYLNNRNPGGWLYDKPRIQHCVVTTYGLKTRKYWNAGNINTTDDDVFILSEADVFGTGNMQSTLATDYTLDTGQINVDLVGGSWKVFQPDGTNAGYLWLRSPSIGANLIAGVAPDGSITCGDVSTDYSSVGNGQFWPAMWIDLSKVPYVQ